VGKMGYYIFRRSHNGKISVYENPFLFKGLKIKWSRAQKDHRQDFGQASKYASAAVADPDLRPIYIQMAIENSKNPKRPYDMAVSDYCKTGNDLLWKKHMGDQEKPPNWDMDRYPWYATPKKKRRRLWPPLSLDLLSKS
jgi:hypothetical protein